MPNFEDLLRSDISWPKPSDVAFTKAPPGRGAHVDPHWLGRLVIMTTGYKEAADHLVQRAVELRYQRDALIYPIIFNYRHFIELNLKCLIVIYGPAVDVPANWKSHDIAALWRQFQKVQDEFGVEEHDQSTPTVRAIIAEFANVDPLSFSFRYPVDTKGNLIHLGVENLDLKRLKNVMDGVETYFRGCDGYLDHLNGAGP